MTQPEPSASPSEANAPREAPRLTLIATNNSTVPGNQCFNIFPPLLTVTPSTPQTPIPLVSSPTMPGGSHSSVVTLEWKSSVGALSFIVLRSGQDPAKAPQTPVALGGALTVTWQNEAFEVASAAGEGAESIAVTFDPGVPPSTVAGLVVGPGPVLFPVPAGGGTLTLTPNMTQIVTARFGTFAPSGTDGFSDLSQPLQVVFRGNDAAITIGPDNLLVQTT